MSKTRIVVEEDLPEVMRASVRPKPGEEPKPTACEKCKHWVCDGDPAYDTCQAAPIMVYSHRTGTLEADGYQCCCIVNTEGKCPHFEAS